MADATLQRPSAAWPRGPLAAKAPLAPPLGGRAPAYVFWLVAAFMLLEYIRPPVITQFKLQMVVILIVPLAWLASPVRPWTSMLTLQTLFLLWCAKSVPLAFNYFNVYFTSRVMYGNVAIGLALTWVGSNLRDFRRVLWIWLAVMTYQGVWALTHGGRGTGGFLGDENDLALACGSALPVALAGFERLRGSTRWLLGGAAVVLLAAIVASSSRGGFIGLVLSVLYLVLASRHKLRSFALIAVGAVLLFSFAPKSYIDELRTIQDTDEGTAKGRKFLWTAAYNMFLDHPIVGVGASNSTFHIGRYQPTNFEGREYNERDWSGMALHSAWFTLLSEHGVPGVLLIGAMIALQFRTIRRLRRDLRARGDVPEAFAREVDCYAIGLNGAVVSFVGCGIFLSVLYYPYFWYFTALAAALDVAVRRELAALPAPAAQTPAAS